MEYKKGNPLSSQQMNAIDFLIKQLSVKDAEENLSPASEQVPPDAFFAYALEHIKSIPQHDYEELLADIVVAYATPGYEEIVLNLQDKNRISLIRFIVLINNRMKSEGRMSPLLKFSADTIKTAGGFLLKNGSNIIDCTFETLLEKKKVSVGAEILRLLSE